MTYLCRVGCKTLTHSINQSAASPLPPLPLPSAPTSPLPLPPLPLASPTAAPLPTGAITVAVIIIIVSVIHY